MANCLAVAFIKIGSTHRQGIIENGAEDCRCFICAPNFCLLFTKELQRRFEDGGAAAIAVAAHPGISNTHLADHLFESPFVDLARPLAGKILQSAAMGALPTLRAAVDPLARGGDYYGPDGFNSFRGYPVRINSSPAAQDTADARRLWNVSECLTGVTYDA